MRRSRTTCSLKFDDVHQRVAMRNSLEKVSVKALLCMMIQSSAQFGWVQHICMYLVGVVNRVSGALNPLTAAVPSLCRAFIGKSTYIVYLPPISVF